MIVELVKSIIRRDKIGFKFILRIFFNYFSFFKYKYETNKYLFRNCCYKFYFHNNRIVSYIIYRKFANDFIFIKVIEVDKRFQKQGHFRKMMTLFLEQNKGKTVTVVPHSEQLNNLYLKFGFRKLSKNLNIFINEGKD